MQSHRVAGVTAFALIALTCLFGASDRQAEELIFLNAPEPDLPLVDVPRLAVGITGGPLRSAVVDTGSTGVALSSSAIPDVDRLPTLGPGTLTYSSSGRIMRGRWVMTPLVIAGRTGRVMTRAMPILAVDAIACTPTARHCTPEQQPGHVAMLGIGFGRRHDGQPDATPDRNPLLDIAYPATLPRAYVITRESIRIGSATPGFTKVGLERDASGLDWSAPGGCIAMNDGPPVCGTVLVDTGITGMFLTVPPDRLPSGSDGRNIAPGTMIAVYLSPAAPAADLRFDVRAGDRADPAAPSTIMLAGVGRRPTFVNTGARVLNRFDYFYDAEAGVVGYRPVGRQAQ